MTNDDCRLLIFEVTDGPTGEFFFFSSSLKNPKSKLNNRHSSIHPDPPTDSTMPPPAVGKAPSPVAGKPPARRPPLEFQRFSLSESQLLPSSVPSPNSARLWSPPTTPATTSTPHPPAPPDGLPRMLVGTPEVCNDGAPEIQADAVFDRVVEVDSPPFDIGSRFRKNDDVLFIGS